MPRVTINQTNFTAGEVSPRCYGRVDLARYQNGAKVMTNVTVNTHGGAERRGGTVFVAEVKDSSKRVRLVPYIFSTEQAYVLEFGDFYMRVYVQGGGQVLDGAMLPYEIATPYSEGMLDDMDYIQGADTMFLFHPEVPINTLRRIAADFWAIQNAPFSVEPFEEVSISFPTVLTIADTTVGAGRAATTAAGAFVMTDLGRRITHLSGVATIDGYISPTSVTLNIASPFPIAVIPADEWELLDSPQVPITPSAASPVGANTTLNTPGQPAWRTGDVGKFVRLNGGMVRITQVTSDVSAVGKIIEELTSVVQSPAGAWTLEATVWSDRFGYPRTGTLYEQRLIAAGSPRYPQTVWGSRSGLFYDFTIGVNDDQAFAFSLPSTGQINPIQRMVTANALAPLTYGGECTLEGGNDEPLTPTNVKSKAPSVYGCSKVKPLRVGNEILFVQRAGRKIRSLAYRIETDTYNAPDLTVLAEHITESGIVDMCYQQEPRSILWCVRTDGKIATLTLDRDEGVIAWTRQETEGLFESAVSIPNAEGDEVWCVVQRTIGVLTKRYVERLDRTRYTDSGIIGSDIAGASVWANLAHLESEQVAVKADGVYMGLFTVTGGEITLPRDAFAVEIGLPFSSSVELLRAEIQAGDGTAQGNAQRIHEISVLLMETTGMKINGDEIAFREFGTNLLDVPPELVSGFKRSGLTDWVRGDEQAIIITQDEPYPFHVLAVVRKLTVNS